MNLGYQNLEKIGLNEFACCSRIGILQLRKFVLLIMRPSIMSTMRQVTWYLLLLPNLLLGACVATTPATPETQILSPRPTLTGQFVPVLTMTAEPTSTATDSSFQVASATEPLSQPTTAATSPIQKTASPEEQTQISEFKDCSLTSIGLRPISDLGADQYYQGEEGGLYGKGSNTPPESHWMVAERESRLILPRNLQGEPSQEGKIGLVAIGMSNARAEFGRFMDLAATEKAGEVILVNGAFPGKVASTWADPDRNDDPWAALEIAINRADLSPEQVQVVWLKNTNAEPRPGKDDFPIFAEKLHEDLAVIVKKVKQSYSNVRLIYLSSRIYGGYSLIPLSPEPFAYQDGYAVRWLIEDQIEGGSVNYDNAPVLMWGPYLWADGMNPRDDGLVWTCDDLMRDGVHPDSSARQKVAEMMLDFFTNDPLTRTWFINSATPEENRPAP
jgi:hypothetical protein